MVRFSIQIIGSKGKFEGIFDGTEAEALQFVKEMNVPGRIILSRIDFNNWKTYIYETQQFPSEELEYKWYLAKEKEIRNQYRNEYNDTIKKLREILNDSIEEIQTSR